MMDWTNKIVLLTGGTGSFGQAFTKVMLEKYRPKALRIFSRDELKQSEMAKRFNNNPLLRFFIGDIREFKRIRRAADGVDIIIHAAAMKQVPTCEYNPFEAVKTNIIGAENIIDAAINYNVEKVLALSSDKAVAPLNLYGATKLCMEKLFIAANSYVGPQRRIRMACSRYGNVIGSRGSVVPLFNEQKKNGELTVTDDRMTRFWMTIEQGVEFVIKCVEMMHGGEVFIPKIPSLKIVDLCKAVDPTCKIKNIGIRPGEKLHELLITKDEARHAMEFEDFFVIEPEESRWAYVPWKDGKHPSDGFRYASDTNDRWMTIDEIKGLIKE